MRWWWLFLGGIACSGGAPEKPPEICRNGADDDGDGDADCADSDCSFLCGEVCGDGADNDFDGLTDCADPGCDGQCAEDCADGRDNDLDGAADCTDSDCGAVCPEVCDDLADNDGDGAIDCDDPDCLSTCDGDGDGYLASAIGGDDCDDGEAAVHPGAAESCNGIDDDCDARTDGDDDDLVDGITYWYDDDQDGYGNLFDERLGCTVPPDAVSQGGDCDDGDGSVHPGAPEVCSGEDDDCDGLTDEDDPGLDLGTLVDWYPDDDGDGYGVVGPTIAACTAPPGTADNTDDCDDQSALIGPPVVWAQDDDGDGYGGGTTQGPQCDAPDADWVPAGLGLDCDDGNAAISPDAVDVCGDGVDQDCADGDFLGCYDTAAIFSLDGAAQIDEIAHTFTGTEVYQYTGTPSGWLICEWTWTMLDWDHDPTAVGVNPIAQPCLDPDGFGCDWEFTVHESGGTMTDGDDCAFYGWSSATTVGPAFGYGWTEAYHSGGLDYGPTMMYFLGAPYSVWVGLHPAANFPHVESYDQGSGAFSYSWDDFAVLPTP